MFTVLGIVFVLFVEIFFPVILPIAVVILLFKFFYENSGKSQKRWGEE